MLSGGHLAFKSTCDKIKRNYWWPAISQDEGRWREGCQACQRRKTTHNRPNLPLVNIPVKKTSEWISTDLVEYKTFLESLVHVPSKFVTSVHASYTIHIPIPNKIRQQGGKNAGWPSLHKFCHTRGTTLWLWQRIWGSRNISLALILKLEKMRNLNAHRIEQELTKRAHLIRHREIRRKNEGEGKHK